MRKKEVLQIIEQLGIGGPDWLQHLLISQSDGKPGLAVVLADSCKTEDVTQIWSGEVLARQLLRLVKNERERCVLAAFAVGGDAGMSFSQVASALGIPPIDLRQIAVDLGAGGLIEEVSDDSLQVRPPALRALLVRDVFFSGPASHPIAQLVTNTRSMASTASVLLSSRQRGAKIDREWLEQMVTSVNSAEIWEHFGWVDRECADLVLSKYPEKACYAAPGLLNYCPERALHALLDADEANVVRGAGTVEHPRRRISEWLFPFQSKARVTIERRNQLLAVLDERVRRKAVGDGRTFAWALAEVLQATFDSVRPSPGNDREFRSIRGTASHQILKEIAEFWPRIRELFRHVPDAHVRTFFDQLENWCVPQRLSLSSRLSEETMELVRGHAREMLSEILEMPRCNRAWRTWAAEVAKWGKLDLAIEVDPVFDALFGNRDRAERGVIWPARMPTRLFASHLLGKVRKL